MANEGKETFRGQGGKGMIVKRVGEGKRRYKTIKEQEKLEVE